MIPDVAAARTALYDAISNVLPGRVFEYAPSSNRVATPAIWIDRHDGFADGPLYQCTWTVVAAADGADLAQMRLLDDVTTAMLTALHAAQPTRLDAHTSTTLPVSDDVTLRAVEFSVVVTVLARSFCPTVPTSVTIPSN